jgi:cytochrome c peroxidase
MIKRLLLVPVILSFTELTFSATPQELLKGYEAQSGNALPSRGEQFFNSKHGKEWSCATCHESPPNHDTRHVVTGKVIKAMSPNANPDRFVDQAKVEKWFKRNCGDVLGRECTAQEKGDVLSWLMTVK